MSSTNQTTHYELSQFVGTDKPAWLSDYNGDMSKIDTAIYTASSTATGADGKADANATNIGNLASLTTTDKTSAVGAINEVDSHADTAQETANTANTNATMALNDIAKFNLSSVNELTVTTNKGTLNTSYTHVYCAKDSTNSIFKVYGQIGINNLSSATGALSISISTTGLNPTTAYTIKAAGILMHDFATGNEYTRSKDITVNTDGTITINDLPTLDGSSTDINVSLLPCLYFNKPFEG